MKKEEASSSLFIYLFSRKLQNTYTWKNFTYKLKNMSIILTRCCQIYKHEISIL
jgi:hypothetical protein